MAWFFPVTPLPIRTDRTLQEVPYVTYTLCFLNVFVHLVSLTMSKAQLDQFHQAWGLQLDSGGPITFVKLFTHAFVHGDIMHLAGNLLLLWLMGTVLEAAIGSLPFLLLYFASLLGAVLIHGTIAHVFFPDTLDTVLIGASGAISGVTGYTAFRFFHVRVQSVLLFTLCCFPVPFFVMWLPMWAYAGYFAGTELFDGIMSIVGHEDSHVAHWAHIGGLALGGLAAVLLRGQEEGKRESVIESSVKATTSGKSGTHSMQEVWALLQKNPKDPELLEAMAGLILAEGVRAESRDYYRLAITHFIAARRPERAAVSYLNLMRAFPNEVLEVRDQMTVAGHLERMGHHHEAAQAFLLASKTYPKDEEAQTALLRAAQLYSRNLNQPAYALQLLQYLLQSYPNSNWAEMARERVKELQRQGITS